MTGPGAMQAADASVDLGVDPRETRNAPSPGPVPAPLLKLLQGLTWVHTLNGLPSCEGCANDGEPGYCRGAGFSPEQSDPDGLVCHCGHYITAVEAHPTRGWECAGTYSEHWPAGDEIDTECGHCGWSPTDEDLADWLAAERVTVEELAEDLGEDRALAIAHAVMEPGA